MDTISHFKYLTETAIQIHSCVYPVAYNFHHLHNPLINSQFPQSPPEYGARYLVKGLFKVNKSKADFIFPNEIFLLHLKWDIYITFVEVSPGLKPNCMLLMSTWEQMRHLRTCSKTFITWSKTLGPM